MDLKIETINGKISIYSKVSIGDGYCFYDVDAEERCYTKKVITPLIDGDAIRKKYVVVQGDAKELNAQIELQGRK